MLECCRNYIWKRYYPDVIGQSETDRSQSTIYNRNTIFRHARGEATTLNEKRLF